MAQAIITPYIDYLTKEAILTTYAELVDLMSSSSLQSGRAYLMTDYETTTTSDDTSSAGHPFDLMIIADSSSSLNSRAFAVKSSRDTTDYFANSDLSKWEIKYDPNNDNSKYAWADPSNGKGVIYWMRDDHGNECCYDFKNIMYKGSYFNARADEQSYPLVFPNGKRLDSSSYYYAFAKCSPILDDDGQPMVGSCYLPDPSTDMSVIQHYFPYNNIMQLYEWHSIMQSKYMLPYNIIACDPSSLGYANRTFDNNFSVTANDNIICNSHNNLYKSHAHMNYLGNMCNYNVLGPGTLGCLFNNNCDSNILQYNNNGLTFGEEASYNNIGSNCAHVNIGEIVQYVDVKGNNRRIDILKDGGIGSSKGYARYITVNNGVTDVSVTCNATLSSNNWAQNYEISVSGQPGNPFVIDLSDEHLNRDYLTRWIAHEDDVIV